MKTHGQVLEAIYEVFGDVPVHSERDERMPDHDFLIIEAGMDDEAWTKLVSLHELILDRPLDLHVVLGSKR